MPCLADRVLSFLLPPHMLYVLEDGKPKKVHTTEEVMLFMGNNNPFVYEVKVPDGQCTFIVLFTPVNLEDVWFPKLFIVDCLHETYGIHRVTETRTLEEAKQWADRMAKSMTERLANGGLKVERGHISA